VRSSCQWSAEVSVRRTCESLQRRTINSSRRLCYCAGVGRAAVPKPLRLRQVRRQLIRCCLASLTCVCVCVCARARVCCEANFRLLSALRWRIQGGAGHRRDLFNPLWMGVNPLIATNPRVYRSRLRPRPSTSANTNITLHDPVGLSISAS